MMKFSTSAAELRALALIKPPPPGPLPPPRGGEHVLRRSGPKARALLRASAERFAQRAGLPRWQADVENTVELGGSQPNELLLMAPVAFEVGPWSDYLQPAASIQLDVRGLGLHYVMRRSFHAAASRRQSAPILRYAEGLVVVAHATLPRFDAAVLMVDIAGPRQVAAFQGDGWLNTDPYEEPKEKRLIAYPDALVGWQNGKKVYLGILGTDNLAPGPLEGVFGPTTFAGSRWEIATLGGPDPLAPVDDDDPDTSESLVGPGTAYMLPRGQDPTWPDERPKAPDPTAPGSYPAQPDLTIAGTSGLVGIQGTTEGNTGQTGYGTQAYAAPGSGLACTTTRWMNARTVASRC